MSDAPQQSETARTTEETVAFVRRRSAVTRRMTRKQTEWRLEALEALPKTPVEARPEPRVGR